MASSRGLRLEVGSWDAPADGPFSAQALRERLERMGYAVHRYTYPPGTFFPDHAHEVDKIDAVVSGRFRMRAHGVEVILEPGQWLAVPRGTTHSAEVVGDEPVVSLDATRRAG